MKLALVAIAAFVLALQASASVIGIDFGSQYIKSVAILPGQPFFTVLDEASKRKSLSLVAFDTHQRFSGNAGEAQAVKIPQVAFMWTHRLLGKPFGCKFQQDLIDAGYPYVFAPTERGTIAVEVDGSKYSVEELVAMQLRMIQHNAVVQGGSPINEVVITVPPFFSQMERQAVYDATAISGLKLLSLINDNSAAAIEYGRERTYSFNETHTACIFNVGASSTTATVVKYSAYPTRNGLVNVPTGQVEVLGNGFNDHLGGNAFDTRLTFYLAEKFQEQVDKAGFKVDVKSLPRVMARLRGAAQKSKEVLSANQEYPVRVESLYDELDFKHLLDRDIFFEISKDLFDGVTPVFSDALADAKVSVDDVDALVLVGGGSRVPRIQEILKDFIGGKELDQSLNADEAISFGAALFAANSSVSFRVRKFGYIDRLQYPVGVRITELLGQDGNEPRSKRASVYSKHARVDSERHIEVPWESDVVVDLQYDGKALPTCTDTKIAQYEVTGIAEACAEYKKHGTPAVQLTFELKPDGLVFLVSGEVSLTFTEMEPAPVKKSSKNDEGTTEPEMRSVSKTLRTPLTIKMSPAGQLRFLDDGMLKASGAIVDALDQRDQHVKDLASARNSLEAHIYETRSKMDEEKVQTHSTPETRESILEKLESAELWLEDNFDSNEVSVFKTKLDELKALSKDIFFRIKEADLRKDALDQLSGVLSSSAKSLKKIRARMSWIPKTLIDTNEKLLNETSEWFASKSSEHQTMSPVENPKFLSADVDAKKQELVDRLALLQQIPKPPPKPAKKIPKNETDAAQKTENPEARSESAKEASQEGSTETPEGNANGSDNEAADNAEEPSAGSSTENTEDSSKEPATDDKSDDNSEKPEL